MIDGVLSSDHGCRVELTAYLYCAARLNAECRIGIQDDGGSGDFSVLRNQDAYVPGPAWG
jgi:hypothetical protein